MRKALEQHWPEYLIEAAALGLFMISACTFGTILEHPASPVHQVLPNSLLRRALMGLAMGSTAIGIVFSPWGKRSGAHMNPSITLTFLWLRKVQPWDAFFYVAAQFAGGVAGVLVAAAALHGLPADPAVHYVVTAPGPAGPGVAFAAEVGISFLMMSTILRVSNHANLARYTGWFAGTLVATYITFEAPVSGMSMNPARTFGSAAPAMFWNALWVYFLAPPLGMLLAAEVYKRRYGLQRVLCAKLHHHNNQRCIFRCGYMGV